MSENFKILPIYILSLIFLILIIFPLSHGQNDKSNYFFSMYPSQNKNKSYIIYSLTPFSEKLTIDLSVEESNKIIKKEQIPDISNNISSIIFYKEEFLVKTCFGANKVVEIIPTKEIDKTYNEINNRYIYSENGLQISKNLKYCFSTIVANPDTSKIKDENIIVTYWVMIKEDGTYNHKCIFFYPYLKKFSSVYNLISNKEFPLSKRYPIHCTTFRYRDIFCSYYDLDLNNQYVIETNKIPKQSSKNPSVYFVLSDFGQINGKNMLPISLNKQNKSIFGGYYDVFLAEFGEKKDVNDNKENKTVILYSLYRKSLHASLVPMFSLFDTFFGINIRDDYIETNLFNYVLEGNEMVFIFIYNNVLQAIRVDYSQEFNIFKKYNDFGELGYYSTKLVNCKNPKYMQSTFINNTIKYNDEEKQIVKNGTRQYILEMDIVSLLSCEDEQGRVNYETNIIKLPQCLVDLDSMNSHEIHKINFYLNISAIIYDIYDDIRLKSFRNVGIMFYPIEHNYLGLLFYQIKLRSKKDYIVPKANQIYYDITHIRFERIRPKYVPYFTKPFHLKYRLFNVETKEEKTINKISSNICFFQIKFFPYNEFPNGNPPKLPSNIPNTYLNEQGTNSIDPNTNVDPDDVCSITSCSLCLKTNIKNNYNGFICQYCDSSELEVMIPDTNEKSETFGACICNITLGFRKDPVINTCYCQDDNAYYKSTNLCWPLMILENGPYFTDKIDDITEIPIYEDCYFSCAKCSKKGNETNHNCEKCKEGFAYIDDDTSNCYNKSNLKEGYHQVDNDRYIKCHDNCISCTQKPSRNQQFCTECRNNVSYYLKENTQDEFFNCFSEKCDLHNPSLLFNNHINSHECVKDCKNGFKPYNNQKICLNKCSDKFPYLDEETNLCYEDCHLNPKNKFTNKDKGTCVYLNQTEEEKCQDINDKNCSIISECGDGKYKNKEGYCVSIPLKCIIVDVNSGLCKICNKGFYPLKEDLNLISFDCYQSLEEIFLVKNKSNYYLNEKGGYWDECFKTCETCNAFGSENMQNCVKCKPHYYKQNYLFNNNDSENNNCLLELTPNDNCTSSQIDMHKYQDFCHLCKNGYAFVFGFEKCYLESELLQGAYYSKKEMKFTGENRDKLIEVKVYYKCYKNCKSCNDKGDLYDNKCNSCLDGLVFDQKSNFKNCISPIETNSDTMNNINTDLIENTILNEPSYQNIKENTVSIDSTEEKNIIEKYLIQDDETNAWFKLGNNSFYFYQEENCYLVFYQKELILISSKESCFNICPIWNISHCSLKKYERFKSLSKKDFNDLLSKAYIYSNIKNDVNIIIPEEEKKIYFHLTNNKSPSPNNISYIDLREYNEEIKSKYGQNLLIIKADIKRSDTQSTQVEYQFFNPSDLNEKIDLEKIISSNNKRRLTIDDNIKVKVNIDLPINWTKTQLENINYLSAQNINAFDSSSKFYTDNCYQFTSSKGNDAFLEERKKIYYPDITLCEEGCIFVKYNSETEKVTCRCDYKINNNNYTNVIFVKNTKDKNFMKNLILENIQSMKCLKVIFKWINLKSNAGFILMLILLVIFGISWVFYYISGEFKVLDNFIKSLQNDKFLFNTLKNSIILENDDKKKGVNSENEGGGTDEPTDTNGGKGFEKQGTIIIDIKPKPKSPEKITSGGSEGSDSGEESSGKRGNVPPNGPEEIHNGEIPPKTEIPNPEGKKSIVSGPPRPLNYSFDSSVNTIQKKSGNKLSMGIIGRIKDETFGGESINNGNNNPKNTSFEVNINIDDILSNKGDNNNNNANIIKISNMSHDDSINLSKVDDKNENIKREEKIDNSRLSKTLDVLDLKSENSDEANPPDGKGKKNESKKKSEGGRNKTKEEKKIGLGIIYPIQNSNMKSSKEEFKEEIIEEEDDFKYKIKMKNIDVNRILLNIRDELLTMEEFNEKYKSFASIYLSDIRKHHILFFLFSYSKNHINNIFLKISLFSINIVLYFSLNTIFVTNSKMSNAYFDLENSNYIYILINLFLPFIICGIIFHILKLYIMPNHYIIRIIRIMQENTTLKNLLGLNKLEEQLKDKSITYEEKKIIINNTKNKFGAHFGNKKRKYENEKSEIEKKFSHLSPKYKKIVIIYFLIGFVFLGFNWYMMTSFCSVYKNSGKKLIVNSIISILSSFTLPFILGFIPTMLGYLTKKFNNEKLFKAYKFVNKIL